MEEGAESSEEGQARSGRARLNAAAPYLIVSAVSLWLTRSFWIPGSYVVGFDTYAYSGPNLEVTERAVREWRVPVLNDFIFGGVPHLGNPSAAALYPPQLLTLVLETNRAMGVLVALHMILLGVGMIVLSRRLGVGVIGATAAGVVAVAAGSTLTKTTQFEQILVLAWMPLLLAAIHAVMSSESPWRSVAALSATTGAILLAGHPQLVYEAAMLAIAAVIGFSIDEQRWRRLPHLAAGAALGACIALPQLVAALAATADSGIAATRDIDLLYSPTLSLDPAFAARALLGTIQDRDQVAFAGGFESIGFLGVVVALLIVVGLAQAIIYRPWRPWAISMSVVALLALIWAAGPRTPLFRIAYALVPGFDLARASARWLVVFVLVAALFAGIGVQVLVRGAQRHHLAAVVGGLAIALTVISFGPPTIADRRSAMIWLVFAVVVIGLIAVNTTTKWERAGRISMVAIVLLGAIELGMMSLHSLPQLSKTDTAFTAHQTETTEWLAMQSGGTTIALTDDGRAAEYQVPGLRPNANALAGIRSLDGYDGGVQITERWADALRRFNPDPPIDLPLRNSLQLPIEPEPLARMGVRFILIDKNRPPDVFIPGWVGPQAADEYFEVWENPFWIGDAVAWHEAVAVDTVDVADLLREALPEVASLALVDQPAAELVCAGAAETCLPIGLPVERESPEHVLVETNFKQPVVLMLTQQALPGWRVEIDGRSADELLIDGLFLGVEVPAGNHVVSWHYQSPWLRTTIVVSLMALAATVVLAIGARFILRRQRPQDAGGGRR